MKNFIDIINNAVKEEKNEIKLITEQTVWEVLNRNKSWYTRKLRSLVLDNYYRVYNPFGENQYYERTMQFMRSAYCKPIQENGRASLEVGFEEQRIGYVAPAQPGFFASYGSFVAGGKGNTEPVSDALKTWIVSQLVEKSNVLEIFWEWFNEDFNKKFDALLAKNLKK